MTITRTLAILVAGLAAAIVSAQAPDATDLIIVNGKVFTADPTAPWAEAVAIHGARITAVGSTATIRQSAPATARVVDAGGRVIIPGINDAHTHVGARPPGVVLKLTSEDPAFAEVLDAVRQTAASSAAPQWIFGTIGERVLSDAKATRSALDEAAPGRAVKLSAWTGHGNILSTQGLRVLGIGDHDADPPFGRYGRQANGELSGLLEEYADVRANRRMTELAGRDAAIASLRRLAGEAGSYGMTTIQAMANSLPAADLPALLIAADAPVRWRVIRFPIALDERDAPADLRPLPRQPSPLITVSGVKWILDGTPIERLAAMNAPYADRDGWSGRLNLSPADIETALRRALDTGEQPMFHITGDRGLDVVLDTMERLAPPERWQPLRVRIEHGGLLAGPRIGRARGLGIVLVQNPSHFSFGPVMRQRFGAERGAAVDAIRSVVAAGVPLAFGGDGPLNPFLNMMFAVTHETNPGQAITREQAVTAYTAGSAYAEFAEREKGQLKAGMLADVAVLSQDIFTVEAGKLPATSSVLTIVNGRIVRDTLTQP